MKFFIDTANVDEIRAANDMGVIAGVTINPSLVAKEGEAPVASELLKNENIQVWVINFCTTKQLDKEIVVNAARACGAIVAAVKELVYGRAVCTDCILRYACSAYLCDQ